MNWKKKERGCPLSCRVLPFVVGTRVTLSFHKCLRSKKLYGLSTCSVWEVCKLFVKKNKRASFFFAKYNTCAGVDGAHMFPCTSPALFWRHWKIIVTPRSIFYFYYMYPTCYFLFANFTRRPLGACGSLFFESEFLFMPVPDTVPVVRVDRLLFFKFRLACNGDWLDDLEAFAVSL